MAYQNIQITVPRDAIDAILKRAERDGVSIAGISAARGKTRTATFLVAPGAQQELIDEMQKACHDIDEWKVAIMPVSAVLPHSPESDEAEELQSREELLERVSADARLTPVTLALIVISAIVAGLGMIVGNVAVIIGAMVIAPLLSPVIAFVMGISLGERRLVVNASLTTVTGISIAVATGMAMGWLMPVDLQGEQLASRARVGFEDVALALAAGVAASLSVTAGVSAALVGVMVAVALLPPAVAVGIFAGEADPALAMSAAMLLAINLSALCISGQIVFLLRGIRPRTWYMRKKVGQSIITSLVTWSALLLVLLVLIWLRPAG